MKVQPIMIQEKSNLYLKKVSVVADIHIADFEVAVNDVSNGSNGFLRWSDQR